MTLKHALAASLSFAALMGYAAGDESQPLRPSSAVADVQAILPAGKIQVHGFLGRRMDDCMDNLITAWDVKRLVQPFRDKTDSGASGNFADQWRCDYWGKWLRALAWGYALDPTDENRQLMDEGVAKLLATEGPDGYIGTFAGERRLIGGYDVWGRQCTIMGLVAYYDMTGEKKALDAACRVLDCTINELEQRKLRIPDLGWPDFKGLAPSAIVQSASLLYLRTGNEKYRNFAEQVAAQWNEPSQYLPQGLRLVDDALAGKSAREIGCNKAYEQLYCYIGICELYRATGEKKYLDAAVALAKKVAEEEIFINGSGSEGEFWFNGRSQQTRIVFNPCETCVTTHWICLCWELLRLTGDPAYADAMETSLYNALLGALMPDGHWWGYYDGLLGERMASWIHQEDVGLTCCIVSGMRGLMSTPFWAVMQAADGPVVNLYFPGQFTAKTPLGGDVQWTIDTDYPREGNVLLSVESDPPETFTLSLRIPAWSRETQLTVNGREQPVQPGTYARIQRLWKKGDRVQLNLDMRGQVLEAPDGNGQLALQRGPIVLALDNRFVPAEQGKSIALDRDAAASAEWKPNPEAAQKAGTWMAFDVPFTTNGAPGTLTLCDYASAGNRWTKTNRFRTWMPQPLDLAGVYETGDNWHSAINAVAPPLPERAKAKRMQIGRILFLGNSITLTPPAPDVGWESNWGMAASAPEKDYVHQLVKSIAERSGKEPETSVNNIAEFERNFDGYDIPAKLKDQLAFQPDAVVIAIGENVPPLSTDALRAKYKERFLALLNAVQRNGRPKIYVRSCFWADPIKDGIMRECCRQVGGVFVDIGDLGRDESNMARSERQYSHAGVAAHPGDKGMKAIADALLDGIMKGESDP